MPVEKVALRVSELHEFNPMLGFRGCRLGIDYPEISAMQSRASERNVHLRRIAEVRVRECSPGRCPSGTTPGCGGPTTAGG